MKYNLDRSLKLPAVRRFIFFLYRVDCTPFFLTKLMVCATPTLHIWYFKLMGSLMLMSTGGAYIRFSCWNLRFWKPQFLVEVQSELTRNRLADSSEAPWQWFFRRICQKVFEQNVRSNFKPWLLRWQKFLQVKWYWSSKVVEYLNVNDNNQFKCLVFLFLSHIKSEFCCFWYLAHIPSNQI